MSCTYRQAPDILCCRELQILTSIAPERMSYSNSEASELDGINPFLRVTDSGPWRETDDEMDNLNYGSVTCVKKRDRERRAGPVFISTIRSSTCLWKCGQIPRRQVLDIPERSLSLGTDESHYHWVPMRLLPRLRFLLRFEIESKIRLSKRHQAPTKPHTSKIMMCLCLPRSE
eukprot:scaffold1519_cov77-Skeletonema_dohrnii-CCMP3373.AAC.1